MFFSFFLLKALLPPSVVFPTAFPQAKRLLRTQVDVRPTYTTDCTDSIPEEHPYLIISLFDIDLRGEKKEILPTFHLPFVFLETIFSFFFSRHPSAPLFILSLSSGRIFVVSRLKSFCICFNSSFPSSFLSRFSYLNGVFFSISLS